MSLRYPHSQPPTAGVPLEVAPGVFWLRMSLPFQLDHINLWLLRDGEGWAIVDTGFADDATRDAWEIVLAGLDGPVERIIVTHFHPDHFGLAEWLLGKTGASLWMTTGEFLTAHAVWHETGGHGAQYMTEQFRQHGLGPELLAKFAKRGSGYRASVPALPERYERLRDDDRISVNGREWRVLVGYGHAPEHAALYCRELGVLISGDMLLPRISTNISVPAAMPNADALGWFLRSLATMVAALPEETLVLPSHGLPFQGMRERVEALEAHHEERLRVLEDSCEAPQSAAGLLATLFPRALDTHQTMFAMGEAIAHLNRLEKLSRLTRSVDAEGVVRFVRPAISAAH